MVNTNALPFPDTHSINFHPALRFSGSIFQKELALSYSSLAQGTVIGIFAPIAATSSSDAALFGLKGRNGEETLVGKDKVHHAGSGAYLDYGKAQGEDLLYGSAEKETKPEFLERFPRVVSYMWANRPVHSVWGEPKQSLVIVGSTPGHRDTRFSQSYLDMTRDVASFDGYIPEFIVFNRMLTPAERLRVESGLALRYGLTLYSSYLDSRGNLLWNFATNKAYHHRVAGIIRDDESKEALQGKTIGKATVRAFRDSRKNFALFLKTRGNGDCLPKEANKDLIENYRLFMLKDLGNKESSVSNRLGHLAKRRI